PAPFSRDGAVLVTWDEKAFVQVWDTATGKEKARFPAMSDTYALAPDGKTLATIVQTDPDGKKDKFTLKLWDLASGKAVATLEGREEPVFSADGSVLAVSGPDEFYLVDAASGEVRAKLLTDRGGVLEWLLSPDAKNVAVRTHSGVKLFEVATGKLLAD